MEYTPEQEMILERRSLIGASMVGLGRCVLDRAATRAKEFHVERYFRECLLHRIAPVSPQLILSYLAERAFGLPKSY